MSATPTPLRAETAAGGPSAAQRTLMYAAVATILVTIAAIVVASSQMDKHPQSHDQWAMVAYIGGGGGFALTALLAALSALLRPYTTPTAVSAEPYRGQAGTETVIDRRPRRHRPTAAVAAASSREITSR